MKIRVLQEKDFEDYVLLFEEVDSLHRAAKPEIFREPDLPFRTLEGFRDLLANPRVCLMAADIEGKCVGLVHAVHQVFGGQWIRRPRNWVLIDNLVVGTSARRGGIGRALVEAVRRWAADQGAEELELRVYDFNREAIAFYSKMGFSPLVSTMSRNV